MRYLRFFCVPLAVVVLFCSLSVSAFAENHDEPYIPILPEFVSMSGDTATLVREFSRSNKTAQVFFSDFYDRPYFIFVTQETYNDYMPPEPPGIGATITQKYVGEDKQWSLTFVKAKSNHGSFFFQVSDLLLVPSATRSMPIRFFAPSSSGNDFEALTYRYTLASKTFSTPIYSRNYTQTFCSYLIGMSPFVSNGSDDNGEYYTLQNSDKTASIGFQIGNPEGEHELYPYPWWIGKNPIKEDFLPTYEPDDGSSETSSGGGSGGTSSGSGSGGGDEPFPEKPMHPADSQVIVTIHYKSGGEFIRPDTVFTVDYGGDVSFRRPDIPGYTCTDTMLYKTNLTSNYEHTFYYTPDGTDPGDIPTQTHTVTIHLKYWDGTYLSNPVRAEVAHGMPFKYDVPLLFDFYYLVSGASLPIASVTKDMELTVTYYPVGYDPNPPPVIKKYTVTIHYQYSNGTMAALSKTITVLSGDSFFQASPIIKGYTPNAQYISDSNVDANATYVVTYFEDAGGGSSSGGSSGSGTTGEPGYSGSSEWKFWDFHDYPYKPLEFEEWDYMQWYEPVDVKPYVTPPSSYPEIPPVIIPSTSSPTMDIPTTSSPTMDIPTTSSPTMDIPTTSSPTMDIPAASSPTMDIPVASVPDFVIEIP